ncbi:MAG: PilZ domain [Acidimicrobiaceae bacterium]|jgi:hypothetical protein
MAEGDVLERYRTEKGGDERREWRRVPVVFSVHCLRLGRRGIDTAVKVVDLSPGGIRLISPKQLDGGDVVELTFSVGDMRIPVRGLVVYTTTTDADERHAHVAFTGLGDAALKGLARLLDSAESGAA